MSLEVPVECRQSHTVEENEEYPVAAVDATRKLTNLTEILVERLEALVSRLNHQFLTQYDGVEKEPTSTQRRWYNPFRADGKQPTEEYQSSRQLFRTISLPKAYTPELSHERSPAMRKRMTPDM